MLLVSFICYGAIAFISLVFGAIYLTRSEFMPYHSLALGKSWSGVEPETQTLILALMRVAGSGFIASGLAAIALLGIALKTGEVRAIYAIFPICLSTSLGSGYATLLVKRRTPGNPPFKLSLATIILSIVGFLSSLGRSNLDTVLDNWRSLF